MNVIKSNRKFDWLISPYRTVISGSGLKKQIADSASTYETQFVCVLEQKYVSFSNLEGQDFALTLQSTMKHDSYLYLEWTNDGCIFVHIRAGELIEDRLIQSNDNVLQALKIIKNRKITKTQYKIETFSIPDDKAINDLLSALVVKGTKVISLNKSLLDSLEFNPVYTFKELRYAERSLTSKGKQNFTVAIAISLLAVYGLFESFNTQVKTERIELNDNYAEYTNEAMSYQSASITLAQDFNMHELMERELIGWRPYRVTYTMNNIKYSMVLEYDSPATLQTLTAFAHENHLEVVHDTEGTHITAPLIRSAPYTKELDVRSYNLDFLVSNIVDNGSKMTPFVGFKIEQLVEKSSVWGERTMLVMFKGAAEHDLLRLASVLDGYPERYPVLIKEASSYQVDPDGVFSEGLKFSVIGDL